MTLGCDTCLGTATLDGVALVAGDPRWCAYDLGVLADGLNQRGTDDLIPGIDGVIDNPRRPTSTPIILPFAVSGLIDEGGYEVGPVGADGRALALVRQLRDDWEGGTVRTFVFQEPDGGATWTGEVHVALDRQSLAQGIWDGFLDLELVRPWEIT